ncbi:MAG: transcription antitermination factor NusB [Solirubrobacterales bacterium]
MKRSDQRRLAVFALYQNDLTGRALDTLIADDATDFTRALAEATLEEREKLDGQITNYAKGNWPIDRIAPLERNILRVAIHELLANGDVPPEVAVDEAVELAKNYCSADAPKFVNGILGSILRDLPAGTSQEPGAASD